MPSPKERAIADAVQALMDEAVQRHCTGGDDPETFLECHMCGQWDDHASTCPVPLLTQWLDQPWGCGLPPPSPPTVTGLNIITSKPKYPHSDHPDDQTTKLAVIYRGVGTAALAAGTPELSMPWVVGTITPQTLAKEEWVWGHYFDTKEQALEYFDGV